MLTRLNQFSIEIVQSYLMLITYLCIVTQNIHFYHMFDKKHLKHILNILFTIC